MRKSPEISCRFELEPRDCDWLITTVARSGAVPTGKTKNLAVYLDTPDAAIGNHGLSFGVRCNGEISPENLKGAIDKAARGPAAPDGWTRFIEPLSAATPVEARRWLQSFLRRRDARERALFRIESQGNQWCVNTDLVHAEISLDRMRIAANRKQASFVTAIFTCKNASARDFFRFVEEICDPAKLRMSAEGVALRSYRLCGKLRASHVSAFAPKLATNMDAAQTFRTIARACFDQFLLNEVAIRLTRDREAVHQCRVALRRLSTSQRLFSSIVSGAGLDELRPDLKRLAEHLQKARDLDVLIGEVIEPAVGAHASTATRELIQIIEERRESAYAELVIAISGPQTAKLFSRLVTWIEAGDWTLDPEREGRRREPIGQFVERKLVKATHKFKKRCDELEEANEEERHHIRIRAKNLRYSAEFFESLVAPKAVPDKGAHRKTGRKRFHTFIAALKDLQTILGKENDVRMARRFLASLAQEIGDGRLADGIKAALAATEPLTSGIGGLLEPEFRKKAAKARRAFAELKPFWGDIASPKSAARRPHGPAL